MIKNVLKDGSTVEDITGHIVKLEYAIPVYNLMSNINTNPRNAHQGGDKENNRIN